MSKHPNAFFRMPMLTPLWRGLSLDRCRILHVGVRHRSFKRLHLCDTRACNGESARVSRKGIDLTFRLQQVVARRNPRGFHLEARGFAPWNGASPQSLVRNASVTAVETSS